MNIILQAMGIITRSYGENLEKALRGRVDFSDMVMEIIWKERVLFHPETLGSPVKAAERSRMEMGLDAADGTLLFSEADRGGSIIFLWHSIGTL